MEVRLLLYLLIICFSFSAAAAEVEVFTQQDWNQGAFSGTSADRNDNSGNLGLGYRNGTSTDSLVGYWRFDRSVSGNGGTVIDYSGNGNDGKAKNGVNTGVQGVFSTNSFKFDGTDDYVALPLSFSSSNIGSFSASAWVNIPSDGGDWSILDFDRSEYFNMVVGIPDNDIYGEGNYVGFHSTNSGGSTSDMWSTTTVRDGNWHHIAWVYDGSKKYIYIDGQLDQTQSISGVGDGTTRYGYIGDGSESSSFDGDRNGFHYEGKVDELRFYDRSLSSSEIKELYLQSEPYEGNYSKSIENSNSKTWNEIEADTSSIPTDTNVDAVFKAIDSSDNVVDEQVIDLQEGEKNYSLDVSDSEKAEIVFDGSSSDVTRSWEINSFKVFTGFCDYRGSKNECVMNSTRQLEPQTYDVDSIFESRSTAVFEAFSGTSILNISNSSRLSGTWKGSFDVRSNPVTIEPGANFKPENGRIIIGE